MYSWTALGGGRSFVMTVNGRIGSNMRSKVVISSTNGATDIFLTGLSFLVSAIVRGLVLGGRAEVTT